MEPNPITSCTHFSPQTTNTRSRANIRDWSPVPPPHALYIKRCRLRARYTSVLALVQCTPRLSVGDAYNSAQAHCTSPRSAGAAHRWYRRTIAGRSSVWDPRFSQAHRQPATHSWSFFFHKQMNYEVSTRPKSRPQRGVKNCQRPEASCKHAESRPIHIAVNDKTPERTFAE